MLSSLTYEAYLLYPMSKSYYFLLEDTKIGKTNTKENKHLIHDNVYKGAIKLKNT